jgi:hypothetical protein
VAGRGSGTAAVGEEGRGRGAVGGGAVRVEEVVVVVVAEGRRGEGREDRAEEAAERRDRRWARTDGREGGGGGSMAEGERGFDSRCGGGDGVRCECD